jgi:putative oxidoreductase
MHTRFRHNHKEKELMNMKYAALFGRIFYSAIFVLGGLSHFSEKTIGLAASQGVPFASILVPISGIMATMGGLSVALGFKAKYGAWMLAMFLVPVTLMMHSFGSTPDDNAIQMVMIMKNVALLGGALLIAYFGSGPLSLDWRRQSATFTRKQAGRFNNIKVHRPPEHDIVLSKDQGKIKKLKLRSHWNSNQ